LFRDDGPGDPARVLDIQHSQPEVVRVDARIANIAARQWTILTLDDLRSCGLTQQAVSKRVSAGRLFRRFCGVYSVVPNPPLEGCFLAAVLACGPFAALSHFSAAALRGWVEWDFRAPEVTAPGPRAHPGIRVHRSPEIERVYVSGIPVTSPARTLADLSAEVPEKQLRRAVNEALNQRAITATDLLATGHRGAKQLRAILAESAPTRSENEDVVLAVLAAAGLPRPEVNQPYLGYVPDFRWPEQRVILEADSRRFHDHLLARADDKARQAVLEAAGETVLRTTWREVTTRPHAVVARVRGALASAEVHNHGLCESTLA
jgi:very-short-patch-repair endonuclease